MKEPTFADRPEMRIAGIMTRVDPDTADWTALWSELFWPRYAELQNIALGPTCFGFYYTTENGDLMDFLAAVRIPEGADPPEGFVVRDVPAAHEAVFEVQMEELAATWGAIFGEWLPTSGLTIADPLPCFEEFGPGGTVGAEPVSIHIPVRTAA